VGCSREVQGHHPWQADTTFRRIIQHVPRLHVSTKAENIAQSAAMDMDGIFPLTTNTKEKPIDVFKIYKYQPNPGSRSDMRCSNQRWRLPRSG
jgi:hypothetical protein